MKKSTKIIIASLLVVGVSGGVFAYGKSGHWNMAPEEKAEFVTNRITKKLDLNENQQRNLQVLADDMLVLMKDMKAGRQAHMNQIQEMLGEPVLDQGKALQMINGKTRQIQSKAPALVASLAVFLDSLNPEQKAELQEFASKRMHHRHDH